MLILSGFDVGMMREYWYQSDDQARRRLTGSVLALVAAWGVSVMALVWLASGVGRSAVCAAGYAGCDLLRADRMALVLAIALVEAIFSLLLTILRIRDQVMTFAALSFTRLVLFLAAAIGGVQLTHDVGGALVGRLAAALIALAAAAFVVRGVVSLTIDLRAIRSVLRYGLPLLPANLAAYILLASDRYVLQSVSSLEVVAIYAFAYKLATALDVLVNRPFALDWAARRFRMAAQPDAPAQYAEVLPVYLAIAGGGGLLLAAATPLAYAWIAPLAYAGGIGLIPILLTAQVVYGASTAVNVGIMLKDGTRHLPAISWLAALICLGLNAWWITSYGAYGAAWATLAAYLIYTVGIAAVSLRLYPVPYDLRRLGLICAALGLGAAGIGLLGQVGAGLPILASVGLKLLWVALIGAVAGHALWPQLLQRGAVSVAAEPPLSGSD
jgi:O-antigen/teichoic acid export membrane protein